MSGYTPVFSSVFDGTLHGRWPHTGIWVCLLAMADKHGCIDKVPRAIATDIGVDVGTLSECIADFCAPDPDSRTAENDGRRLELIDPARPWGWRIINHGKYREKARKAASDAERVASGREAERKRQERMSREVPRSPEPSRPVPPSDSDSDSDSGKESEGGANAPKPAAKKRVASRIPENWHPSESLAAYAEKELPNVDVAKLAEGFVDYWRAAAGEKARKLDWDATWRTWVRRSVDRYPTKPTVAVLPSRPVRIDPNGREIHG